MKYTKTMIAEKNITLSFEFERYLLEHPEVLEQIPSGAEVILLPKDDPQLYQVNLTSARKARRQHRSARIVFVEIDALAPPRSRLINPKVKTRLSPGSLATPG